MWKPLAARELAAELVRSRRRTSCTSARTDSLWGASAAATRIIPSSRVRSISGSVVRRFAPRRARGVFAALDLTTNKLAWRQQWVDQCYSGSVVTAGGLVFVGRNDGRLHGARQSRTAGSSGNSRRTRGVNAPASIFEYEGKQYVVVYSGGSLVRGTAKRRQRVAVFLERHFGTGRLAFENRGSVTRDYACTSGASHGARRSAVRCR